MRLAFRSLIAIAAAFVVIVAAPAEAAFKPLAVVSLPYSEAFSLLEHHHGALALGVFPDSRRGRDFWREVSAGAPQARAGVASPLSGQECALEKILLDAGALPNVSRTIDAPDEAVDAVVLSLCSPASTSLPAAGAPGAVAVAVESQAERFVSARGTTIVLGSAPDTPVLVGLIGSGEGVLTGGVPRRPGLATPYDVATTILREAGVAEPANGFIGKALRVDRDSKAPGRVAALARRLLRDADYGPAVAAATIVVLLGGGVFLPIGFLFMGIAGVGWAPRAALRAARGAALAVSGYVASLFVPTSNAALRALPIVVAYVIGALARTRDARAERRRIALILGGASILIAVLTIASALRPGGEPALSLWGNPLVSWRFYGLRNHLTSMLALGVLAGIPAMRDEPSPGWNALAGVAGLVVVGAAFLGANFVAVLTIAFGTAMATFIIAQRRVALLGAVSAAAIAVICFGGALLADAGSPASHGGQAVQRVRAGGLHAAFEFVRIRWRLNVQQIGDLWGGWVWALLLLGGLVALLVWTLREETIPLGSRAALVGGSASALAALFMEDTGFLTGGIIALAPALVAATLLVERIRPPTGDVAQGTPEPLPG